MTNKIYIVAGERNMKSAAQQGGLYANVGQTSRQVSERLRDDDYKRKAAGGKWNILYEQPVGDLSDHAIHPLLKNHPRIRWENSDNTEEFLFLDDPGDGSEARKIVHEILSQRCVPLLKDKLKELSQENVSLKGELTTALSLIGPAGIDIKKYTDAVDASNSDKIVIKRLGEEVKVARQETTGVREKYTAAISAHSSDKAELNRLREEVWDVRQETTDVREKYDILSKRMSSATADTARYRADATAYSQAANEYAVRATKLESEVDRGNGLLFVTVVLAAILFFVGRFWANKAHLEALATVEKERSAAYTALHKSDDELKELQAKMKEMEARQKSETTQKPETGKKSAKHAVRSKKQSEKTQETARRQLVQAAAQETATQSITQFETCIYGKTNGNSLLLDFVMDCNVGNELPMKKCLVAAGGDRVVSYVYHTESTKCWTQTH